MDMISLLLRTGEPSRSTCGKLGGTCGGGGRGKEPEEGGVAVVDIGGTGRKSDGV